MMRTWNFDLRLNPDLASTPMQAMTRNSARTSPRSPARTTSRTTTRNPARNTALGEIRNETFRIVSGPRAY